MNRRRALRWAGVASFLGLGGAQATRGQRDRKPQGSHPEQLGPEKITESLVRSRVGHQIEDIHAVDFSPDGSKILTGGNPGNLLPIVDAKSLDGSGRPPRIITNAANPVLRMWDAVTGKLVRSFADHPAPILAAAFSPNGARIASGGPAAYMAGDKEMRENLRRRTIVGGRNKLGDVVWVDYLVKVWEVATGKVIHEFEGSGGIIGALAYGRVIAALDSHDTFRLWDPERGRPDNRSLEDLKDESGQFYNLYRQSATFSEDALRAVAVRNGPKPVLKQWDAAKGRARMWNLDPDEISTSVVIDPDAKYFATASQNNKIRLWDFETRGLVREFERPEDEASGEVQSFSPDGALLATGGRDDAVHVWDVASGRRIASALVTDPHDAAKRSGNIRAVIFLPGGSVRVASGGSEFVIVRRKGQAFGQVETDPETGIAKREPLLVWDFEL